MRFAMIPELVKQMFKKPFTNLFPAKYAPSSVGKFVESVKKGEIKINPPIETPEGFRGKILYDREKCIGCQLCTKVCPSDAIEFLPEKKKIRIYVTRCTFCAQCVDACPVNALKSSDEFMLSTTDRFSKELIIE
ncbi:MAG TPA: 4Fe-4S dicluster domain-containing protein [Thermoplasmatales archaeon]|nr:4Fe-4S dicluster domain-containing protein [Thermoplasmatales archaeon]